MSLRRVSIARRVSAVAAFAAVLAGCGNDAPDSSVQVFAAASLTEAFAEMAAAFEAENPAMSVTLNLAASSQLAAQIAEGAPADVFAAADEITMNSVVDSVATLGPPQVFATNTLQIIVGAGNPLGIGGLADLADPNVIVVAASPEVPIGAYSATVLERAGVLVSPASFEESVKGVVGKVTLGEADAGIVYVTDVIAAGALAEGIEIDDDINVVAKYPIAVPSGADDPTGANAFIAFVLSPQGQQILAAYGFGSA